MSELIAVDLLEGPTYQYIPSIDASAYLKVEVVQAYDLVDGIRSREMVWHRYSYSDTVSGTYEPLYDIPFGLAAVSGSAL